MSDDDLLERLDAAFPQKNGRNKQRDIGLLANSIAMERITWLWPGRLPLGMLSGLDGDPELGKSQLVAYEAAMVSTGGRWFDGHQCPQGGVVLVSAEDPAASVLVPRLKAAGADLERILIVSSIPDGYGKQRLISLPDDVFLLRWSIQQMQARLLVFDPITSYLALDVNANADKDVRQALTPLAEMLAQEDCCGQMLRHLSKNDKVSTALYRGLGSIAFTAMARTSMTVAKDKENRGQFLLAMTKSNVGAKPKARRYSIEGVNLGEGIETAKLVFGEETDHDADELTTRFGSYEKKQRSAKEILLELLADGPKDSEECLTALEEAGIGHSSAFKYKKQLGIKAQKSSFSGRWQWFLEAPRTSVRSVHGESDSEAARARAYTQPLGLLDTWKRPSVQELDPPRERTLRTDVCTLRGENACARHIRLLDAQGRCPVSGELVKEEE